MQRHFLLLFSTFCSLFAAYGQNNAIEGLMSKRVITYKDASYNTALLIPGLYKENKTDTIAALISYTEQNYGSTPVIVPYLIISQIKTRTFKEEIKNLPLGAKDSLLKSSDSTFYEDNIFNYYLQWYKDNYNIAGDDHYPPYFRTAYGDYFAFLSSLSKECLSITDLTPVEKWLLNYFIAPDSTPLKQIYSTEFHGSSLRKSWLRHNYHQYSITGTGAALVAGLWSPTNHLSIVGNHPYVGFSAGGRTERILCDLRMDFRFQRSPYNYDVPIGRIIYNTSHFEGLNIGLDGGLEIFRHRKHEIDLLGGIAWEFFQTVSTSTIADDKLSTDAGSFNSLNLNAGLGYRFFCNHKIKKDSEHFSYLTLQGKYNFLFFNNEGGSDFHGGAWTIGLNYGFYSRSVHHFHIGL